MGIKEKLKKLISEGEAVLKSAYQKDVGITVKANEWLHQKETHNEIIQTFVDETLFNTWYEKVRLFLDRNNYAASFCEFIRFSTNYDVTKAQLCNLNAIYETIEDIISVNDENWGYLPDNVKSLFKDTHYSEAVFEAFKYVEVKVRDKSNLINLNGVALMRKAFNKDSGGLINTTLPEAERQAQSDLFAGAIGFIRNPKAHNRITIKQEKAVELLYFANYLLRILDGDYSKRELG
ncbi:MAG: TIGR02391 family protein [Candidatus Gastranaerophilales bacterium]|nr:TIGR02391 family protein [Candidatus Gastranaerophilales bacterium]